MVPRETMGKTASPARTAWGPLGNGLKTLRLAAQVLQSNVTRPGFPYKLNFAVTWRCNSRCHFCRIWERQPGPEMTLGEIETFFRRSSRFSWVDLTGGEVFLREDIVGIAAAAIAHCRDLALLHFPTNGILVSRTVEAVREILALRPPRLVVTVSIDGPRGLHDRLRGVEGGFAVALETYRRLRGLQGCEVYLGMTLSPRNVGRVEETLDEVRREVPGAGWEDLHVNIAHPSSHYYGNVPEERWSAGEPDETIAAILRGWATRSPTALGWFERQYLSRAARFVGDHRLPLPCRALAASCFLDPEGMVYPCTGFDRPLGRASEWGYDLKALWEAPHVLALARDIGRGSCPGCWSPCEAYPAIGGNLLRLLGGRRGRTTGRAQIRSS